MSGDLVVVTGGAGFIGSHTVDALVAAGHPVCVVDNFSTGRRENLAQHQGTGKVDIVECNIADGLFAPLAEVTRRRGPVARIVHLAAQTSVVYSVDNPIDEARSNYMGSLHVLEYARRSGVRAVAFASSAAAYGDVAASELPVSEDTPCVPLSPYGIDKRAVELSLSYHAVVHGIATRPLRFFNVYGPRQDPGSPYSGVISIFVARALANKELVIFGDGQQTRDFVYVGDVVRAIVAAALADKADGQPVNVATGRESTITQLAEHLVELCGSSGGIRNAEARAGEIHRSVAVVDRARELLGFEAEVELAEGLSRTVEWLRAESLS